MFSGELEVSLAPKVILYQLMTRHIMTHKEVDLCQTLKKIASTFRVAGTGLLMKEQEEMTLGKQCY
jgi:hypothetical protein